jgi:nucleotide-binding universal stress UspA family protein
VAGDIGARVTAVAIEQDIPVRPKVTISIDPEEVRSVSNAHGLLQSFDAAAKRFGVRNEQRLEALAAEDVAANIANHARLRDLSIVLVKSYDAESEKIVEGLIFGSGRPVLLCPIEFVAELAVAFDQVAVAWDHTAPAARAVADALPMLKAAASVRVITATDTKTPAELASGAAMVSHLEEHGITATFETVKIGGSSIGKVFETYVKVHAIDLLVMGAYRHSRLNEFVWGGATKTVIGRPTCWVMMSR